MNGIMNFSSVNEAASSLYNNAKDLTAPGLVVLLAIGKMPVVAAQDGTNLVGLGVGISLGTCALLIGGGIAGWWIYNRCKDHSDYEEIPDKPWYGHGPILENGHLVGHNTQHNNDIRSVPPSESLTANSGLEEHDK